MPEAARTPQTRAPRLRRRAPRLWVAGAALAGTVATAGCDSARLFASYPAPESPGVEDAPYPRLIDGPDLYELVATAPDPEKGEAVAETLSAQARAAAERAEALSGPVVPVEALRADARRMRERARE